ncbi:MAG: PASTA domain-containing protein, partial [Sedimentisphaerales bacterium]|nr:PASTA domain-containing protein [Sedimentisphaerales bacterium]
GPNTVRAFGLDITVSGDANITAMDMVSTDYRIFPGQIEIVEGEVTDYGTPYAADDLGDGTLTVEMGSLYAADDPCKQNPPPASGTLFTFQFVCGDDESVLTVAENVARGGVVMEDPDEDPNVVFVGSGVVVCVGGVECNVPDVVGLTQAQACQDIEDANLICDAAEECNDTVPDGQVMSQNPAPGKADCNSVVHIVVSKNPPLPGAATLTSPAANAICLAPAPTLTWTVGSGTATQDVRFGTTNPPPVVAADVNASVTTYVTATVNYTKYYWTVDEKNECGEVTAGTVQCFLTGANAGKLCCQNEVAPAETCLGNANHDAYVRSTDVTALFSFIQAIGSPYRCTPTAGSTSCPVCDDVNGDGTVRSTDVTALFSLIQSWGSPYRKTCPWLTCP